MSTETLSIRLDEEVKRRLESIATITRRSRSFLAAEAITRYVDQEIQQLADIEAGLTELDSGQGIPGEKARRHLRKHSQRQSRRKPK